MKSVKGTIKQAVNVMREELLKEFGRGRGAVKRAEDGKPTTPRIYGQHKKKQPHSKINHLGLGSQGRTGCVEVCLS